MNDRMNLSPGDLTQPVDDLVPAFRSMSGPNSYVGMLDRDSPLIFLEGHSMDSQFAWFVTHLGRCLVNLKLTTAGYTKDAR